MDLFDTLGAFTSALSAFWTETAHLWLSPWGLGIVGLCVGSFLNVVVHRLPKMMDRGWLAEVAAMLQNGEGLQASLGEHLDTATRQRLTSDGAKLAQAVEALPPLTLSRPASRCPHCGHVIRWYENIPVLSWLALRGRCSGCRAPISPRYPLVELLTGLLFAAVGAHFGAVPPALLWCGVVACLLAMSLIDWDTTLLPDDLTYPLLWAGLIVATLGWNTGLRGGLSDALWGAVAGYMSLWTVTWLFKLVTGKVGMGQGDFKLLAALGAWLGAPMILPIVLGASLIGAVVGIGMKATGALREGRYVPFGPFLAGAGLTVLLAGQTRVMQWMGWYGV